MPPSNKSLKEITARRERRERLLTTAMFFAAVALTVSFLLGDMGFFQLSKMKAALGQSQREVEILEQANNTLLDELTALKTDLFYLELLARERLGYIKKGELSYEFPP